jgi:hypothetical protein
MKLCLWDGVCSQLILLLLAAETLKQERHFCKAPNVEVKEVVLVLYVNGLGVISRLQFWEHFSQFLTLFFSYLS